MASKSSVIDLICKLDIEVLKEQAESVESMLEWIDREIHLGGEEDTIERLEIDKSNLEGLLEFLDNLVEAVEEDDYGYGDY